MVPRGGTVREAFLAGILWFLFVLFVHTHTFMMYTPGPTSPRDGGCAESEPAVDDGVGELT